MIDLNQYKGTFPWVDEIIAELEMERNLNAKFREVLSKISKHLDGIKYELEASVYTLTDDEFEIVFFCRDIADEVLEEYAKLDT